VRWLDLSPKRRDALDLEIPLRGLPSSDYGEKYSEHVIEQYKLYVEMADRISARRQTANSFFLSINTALLAFVGLFASKESALNIPLPWTVAVAAAGMVLCYSWYRLVRSYRDLNRSKFRVVQAMERLLPLAPFEAEWIGAGRGEDARLYLPFTDVEIRVPWIFMGLYMILAIYRVLTAFQ
jgi:hypothetical protein